MADTFSRRRFEDGLRRLEAYDHLDHKARTDWFGRGQVEELPGGQELKSPAHSLAFLALGRVDHKDRVHGAPALFRVGPGDTVEALEDSWLALLPPAAPGSAAPPAARRQGREGP